MWRAKEWWKLIYWSTKLTYKIPNRAKIVHSEVWHDTQCASRTEQNCMFMLLLLVHQSQFVTIWRHPVVTTSKDSRFHFPIPKWPPGVALWDQYRYIFKRLRIVPPVVAYRVYIYITQRSSLIGWLIVNPAYVVTHVIPIDNSTVTWSKVIPKCALIMETYQPNLKICYF